MMPKRMKRKIRDRLRETLIEIREEKIDSVDSGRNPVLAGILLLLTAILILFAVFTLFGGE